MKMTIQPDQHNANKGTRRGKELLRQSLKELGGGRSILLDKDGNIIAGNKTFEGAQEEGLTVRVIKAERGELVAVQRDDLDLNDPTGEARRLAYLDNRVSELDLAWDPDQLATDMAAGLNFDGAGFLEGELRQLLEQAGIEQDAYVDPGDQREKGEELVRKWGVEQGEIWQLGNHRLLCGDCTDLQAIDRLMEEARATLCFTSPPYWVGKQYEAQTSEAEIAEFIEKTARMLNSVVRLDQSRIVINTGTGFTTALNKKVKRHVLLLIDQWTNALRELGWNLRHVRHWLKEGQLMSTSPRTDVIDQHCEFLGTYEHEGGEEMRFADMFNEQDVQSLLTFYHTQGKQRGQEWTGSTWALRAYWDDIKGTASANGHEAAFPLELPLRHLMLYTKRGEMVFEPFCGSGTTLIACEVMGRVCYGIELSPAYVAATLERWSVLTGSNPTLYTRETQL
jgi:DNA modification methylase